MPRGVYQEKACRVCAKLFRPTNGKQWRCPKCAKQEKRPDKAPRCACGCRKRVSWSRALKGWRVFVWGHALRKKYATVDAAVMAKTMAHSQWNAGHRTRYSYRCVSCKKKFKTKLKNSKFCSRACFGDSERGDKHRWWRGKEKTRYVVRGDNVKVHRAVMEKILGRPLLSTEIVHHIDENGLNNASNNLYLFHCTACHSFFHKTKGAQLQYGYEAGNEIDFCDTLLWRFRSCVV